MLEPITAAAYGAGSYSGKETTQSGVCGSSELPVTATWRFGSDSTLRVVGPFTRTYALTILPGGAFTGTGAGTIPEVAPFTATITGQVDGEAVRGREILKFTPGPEAGCPGRQTVLDFAGQVVL